MSEGVCNTQLNSILKKLLSGKFPELTYVGKNYTKADLIKELSELKCNLEGSRNGSD